MTNGHRLAYLSQSDSEKKKRKKSKMATPVRLIAYSHDRNYATNPRNPKPSVIRMYCVGVRNHVFGN